MHRATFAVLAAALLLAGCASGDDGGAAAGGSPSTTSSPTATGTPEPAPSVVQITVAVRDGKVVPKARRVEVPVDSQVRLQVTSDVDDELHVHGLDIEEGLEAGRTATVELTADQQGVFEVETHESELLLLQLEVR